MLTLKMLTSKLNVDQAFVMVGQDASGNAIPLRLLSDGSLASGGDEYETVAASATAQSLGATGAVGDFIAGILVIPANTSPGAIAVLDGATSVTVFAGGATSVSNLVPFFIPLNLKSVSGAWKITTGADVSVVATGNFT